MRQNPWPRRVQRGLKRLLPSWIYRRLIGRHDEWSLRLWRDLASKVAGDRAILDIGAFRGEYALIAREVNDAVAIYAFEPNPHSLEALTRNCESRRITILDTAVAEHSGEARLSDSSAQSRITSRGEFAVKTIALDDWWKEERIAPALIKIDIEGYEASVVLGAREMIKECKPAILCEVLNDPAGLELVAALEPCNYRFLRIDENTGTEERQTITREDWRHKNWLLLPR